MKKIISIALSVLMLIAISVPVLAADIVNGGASQAADVLVKTTLTGGSVDENGTYTITIPANMDIAWGKTDATDVSYTVDSQLGLGASLDVEITSAGKLVNAGTSKFLSYTNVKFASANYSELNDNVSSGSSITISDWSGVPVADYSDTLTYSVTFNAAP